MHRGYIKLWRKIQYSDLWDCEKFTKAQAWIDLIMLANYKTRKILLRGIPVIVERGQLAHSEVTLAERWRWSRGKVRRFLQELEQQTEPQIKQHKTNITSIITILNYNEYQETVQQIEQEMEQQTVQQTDSKQNSKRYTDNKDNKDKKDNKKTYPVWLDLNLWSEFKRHRVQLKSKMTDHAEMRNITTLKKIMDSTGATQQQIINQSIERGWKGLFEVKVVENKIYKTPQEIEREDLEKWKSRYSR